MKPKIYLVDAEAFGHCWCLECPDGQIFLFGLRGWHRAINTLLHFDWQKPKFGVWPGEAFTVRVGKSWRRVLPPEGALRLGDK